MYFSKEKNEMKDELSNFDKIEALTNILEIDQEYRLKYSSFSELGNKSDDNL